MAINERPALAGTRPVDAFTLLTEACTSSVSLTVKTPEQSNDVPNQDRIWASWLFLTTASGSGDAL
jgi:hypothetical protein